MRPILPAPLDAAARVLRGPVIVLVALATAASSVGCVYRMSVQQGNYIDAKQIDQVESGMTRSQVSFLLGTPMIPNGFDSDRWDYYYSLKQGRVRRLVTRRVTVLFENDRVKSVERGPGVEPATAAAQAGAATSATPGAEPAATATP